MTPGFEKSIVEECIKQDIAVFPGVFSPGEIMEGIQLGIEIFKVFRLEHLDRLTLKI